MHSEFTPSTFTPSKCTTSKSILLKAYTLKVNTLGAYTTKDSEVDDSLVGADVPELLPAPVGLDIPDIIIIPDSVYEDSVEKDVDIPDSVEKVVEQDKVCV